MVFVDLRKNGAKEIIPGYFAKFVHSENLTLVYWDIDEGAPLPEHSHSNEQVANVIEGRFELTVEGKTLALEPGQVAVIPANAVHSGKAITKCKIIDVFYPVREDYRNK